MNLNEYSQIKNMNYDDYCDYLQQKYGIGRGDYFTSSWNYNSGKTSRTKEGLFSHHKMEDRAIQLSTPSYAKQQPFDYQKAENLVYCDHLEHMLLHLLICEKVYKDADSLVDKVCDDGGTIYGFGGLTNYIVPELNDFYSGWRATLQWKQNCQDKIKDQKDVYIELLKRSVSWLERCGFDRKKLMTSFNEKYGLWTKDQNAELYKMIEDF